MIIYVWTAAAQVTKYICRLMLHATIYCHSVCSQRQPHTHVIPMLQVMFKRASMPGLDTRDSKKEAVKLAFSSSAIACCLSIRALAHCRAHHGP